MSETNPTTFVIFGASGDLTRRKLIPALFNSYCKDRLPAQFNIVGFARRPWDKVKLCQILQEGMLEFAADAYNAEKWQTFASNVSYVRGDLDTLEDYQTLGRHLDEIEDGPGNRLYYLATAPRFFVPIVENLGAADMVQQADGWRRVVIEKPFGHDLASAQSLNEAVHDVLKKIRFTGLIIIWVRRRRKTFCTSALPTLFLSRCGIAIT